MTSYRLHLDLFFHLRLLVTYCRGKDISETTGIGGIGGSAKLLRVKAITRFSLQLFLSRVKYENMHSYSASLLISQLVITGLSVGTSE
jgi:hypothetical protein